MRLSNLQPFLAAASLSLSVPIALANNNGSSSNSSSSSGALSLSDVLSSSNLAIPVDFPDAPVNTTNVVKDNFLGISIELSVLNYLCTCI